MYVLLVELLLVKFNSKDLLVLAVSFIVLTLILIFLTFFSLYSPLCIRYVPTSLSYCVNLTLYLTVLIFSIFSELTISIKLCFTSCFGVYLLSTLQFILDGCGSFFLHHFLHIVIIFQLDCFM